MAVDEGAMMDFRILGPLEVLESGTPLELGARKHRELLAMLLIHANEVVSIDLLIDALWEEEPPERAQKALQVYVSQLRKTLGRERVETVPPGYRLRVSDEQKGNVVMAERTRSKLADAT